MNAAVCALCSCICNGVIKDELIERMTKSSQNTQISLPSLAPLLKALLGVIESFRNFVKALVHF